MFMSKKCENDVLKIVHGLSCRHLRGKWLTSAIAERRMTTRIPVKTRKSVRCARAPLKAISVPPPRPLKQRAAWATCTACTGRACAGHAAPSPAWITMHQSTYDM
jgi:hypothetical protein